MITDFSKLPSYASNLIEYQRFTTREVMVGNVGIGGNNPIRVQSMTTTDTMDTEATVAQSIRMIEAGCELVRITAPSMKEANNLQNIKDALRAKGYNTPLVADIHFTPNAAIVAAGIVEKVRVNPGNYADKKKFEEIEYTDASYQEELDRIREKFTPLVEVCKQHGTAMRIGTNHGSLSDRIMSRYGDSPEGMVASAMEFLEICEDLNYHEIIISMKASNTIVMIEAYRLLVAEMKSRGMNYPLHLGVTEAGDGEDGRIKSAVGIGALLEDGLGDTIRVSLTEEPEAEIPVAKKLMELVADRKSVQNEAPLSLHTPFQYQRRKSKAVGNIGGGQVPVVIADLSNRDEVKPASLFPLGYQYSVALDKYNFTDMAVDWVYTGDLETPNNWPGGLGRISNDVSQASQMHFPLVKWDGSKELPKTHYFFLEIEDKKWESHLVEIAKNQYAIPVVYSHSENAMTSIRKPLLEWYAIEEEVNPIILQFTLKGADKEKAQLDAAAVLGGLFADGLGDGIWLKGEKEDTALINRLAFGILQATRSRISKTEYISCPSCGRTLFDLQETTAKIRESTSHLKGVKIGIMGCIVNGPGEMADADYGYVGTGPGKIALYKEKEVVQKNVPEDEAVEALIGLIKEHGDWRELESNS